MPLLKRRTLTPEERVTRNLAKIEKQGAGMVRGAHIFATLLVIATSLATLISLAADSITIVQADWQRKRQVNVPLSVSLAITGLIVLACDTAMLYAAQRVRMLTARRASPWAIALHTAIMLLVGALEALTYAYMLFKYEAPAASDHMAGFLIIVRAVAVPIVSIYLSMAERFSITPSDIALQNELALGIGVLTDMVHLAHNPLAEMPQGLPRKLAMYEAAAELSPGQRTKLIRMYRAARGAVTFDADERTIVDADPTPAPAQAFTEALPPPDESLRMPSFAAAPNAPKAGPVTATSTAPAAADAPHMAPKAKAAPARRKKPAAKASAPAPMPVDERQQIVFSYLSEHPGTSTRKLAAALGMTTTAAHTDILAWRAAQRAQHTPGPVSEQTQRTAPPEPETISDAWVGMIEDAAKEWIAAHPTATVEDVVKQFGLDEDYAAELLAAAR
jgi:hypothetical protein